MNKLLKYLHNSRNIFHALVSSDKRIDDTSIFFFVTTFMRRLPRVSCIINFHSTEICKQWVNSPCLSKTFHFLMVQTRNFPFFLSCFYLFADLWLHQSEKHKIEMKKKKKIIIFLYWLKVRRLRKIIQALLSTVQM